MQPANAILIARCARLFERSQPNAGVGGMRIRGLIIGAVVGALFGAALTIAVGTGVLPPMINRLAMPGVVLLWGTAIGWIGVVAVNSAVYAAFGVMLGGLVARRGRATVG